MPAPFVAGSAAAPGESWACGLVCSRSGQRRGIDSPAFLSPLGAPWLVDYALDGQRGEAWSRELASRRWSLWRYRELLPIADFASRIDLGEGGTPLLAMRRAAPDGVEVLLKDESLNPTGSFKARGLSLAVNRARELGAPGVQLASAGNAAIALAAYAAAAGLAARVALPDDTPGPVVERCRLHGAEVVTAPGSLVEARAALDAFEDGFWDLSTLREPYRVEGKKTMGLELAEQLGWRLPDWIVYPTGGGTGIIGMWKAFDELERLGLLNGPRPRFAVVQMAGCAPLVEAFHREVEEAPPWPHPETRVWGLRVPRALGDFLVLRATRASGGTAVAVAEEALPSVARRAARLEGITIGPEGAAAWAAIDRLAEEGTIRRGQRVVLFQTGDPANYLWRP